MEMEYALKKEFDFQSLFALQTNIAIAKKKKKS